MGSCWKQIAKDYLWAQVGEPCGKSSSYAREMDAIHFYNYPKDGAANSCALFCDNALLHSCTEPSYDDDPEGAKWTALSAMYEPQSEGANDCAGCAQKIRQFKKYGAWYEDTQDFCELDEIFFGSPDYVSDINPLGAYHTGMIVAWGYIEELGKDGFTYIDGNSYYQGESGMVGYHYVAYDDPKIIGAGRPNWDGWLPDEKKPDDVKPEPTPEPDVTVEKYEVCVDDDSWLNVRSGAGKSYPAIWKLYNGDVVPIFEIEDGWGRIDDYGWVCMEYMKKV
jgi:hypothetical protein